MTALSTNTDARSSLLDIAGDPHKFMERALEEFGRPLRGPQPRSGFDVVQNDDSYEFQVNAPGFGADDVEAEIRDGTLHVTGSRENEDGDGKRVVQRRRTSFEYRWPLGDDMDAENVSASLENGVLSVHVPRKDQYVEGGAKQIEIE